ncbi:MAG: DUF1223 domain-containing protein [Gammaproteobacteria bacterium]|nr:MAG: DUF1223 domain-containing protein [Gammaproteobacteria bacterium]
MCIRGLVVFLSLTACAAQADPLVFNSGNAQVTLLELYTSQGCSSCPPAERWLNELTDSGDLWTGIVPVALHVDYWDYLGWEDPFAIPENAQRQRSYAQHNRARTVYTPGMFVNGREWRGWIYRFRPRASGRAPGVLSARIENGQLQASFPADGAELELHVAVLGFDIATRVKHGENRKRTLQQEFVALAHSVHHSPNGRWSVPLPDTTQPAGRYGIALWVSAADNPMPLQATGGWLPQKDRIARR